MRYLLLCLFVCVLYAGCSTDGSTNGTQGQKSTRIDAESPDIAIEIDNGTPGTVYLIGTFTGQKYRADSTRLDASGKIRFKRKTPYRPGFYYLVFPDSKNLQLLLDRDQTMTIKANAIDLLNTTQIEGNIDSKLLMDNIRYENLFQAQLGPLNNRIKQTPEGSPELQSLGAQKEALNKQRKADLELIFKEHPNAFFTSFKRAGQNPEIADVRNPDGSLNRALQIYLYRTAFWDDVDFSDERLLYTPVISNKLKRYIEQLTPQLPDSINQAAKFLVDKVVDYPEYFKYIANHITLAYEPTKTTLMDPEKVYVSMIQNYFTKERAFWADSMTVFGLQKRAYEMSNSLTGSKGPNVEAKDPSGKTQSIYDIKSDYIIVYLFNPTCEHCMEQTPKLVQLYNSTSRKDIEVFSIAIDTNDAEWKNYIQKTKMNWINVHDPTNASIYAKYYVDVTPEIYVLNPDRTIIAKNLKVNQIMEVINRDRGQ
ncbi:MAG: thioredoxin-like domain-containing protein [Bacteroidota bacterium]